MKSWFYKVLHNFFYGIEPLSILSIRSFLLNAKVMTEEKILQSIRSKLLH